MTSGHLFLPCAAGVEALLLGECQRLLREGGSSAALEAVRGGVWVDDATPPDAMRLCLHSRLAQRVLWHLAEAPYRDERDVYDIARRIDWQAWIRPEQTLRVDVTAQRSPLRSLNFAALTVKDAVCDQLREATGERPSVDTKAPHLTIALHLGPEQALISIDLAGAPLFKRGWRQDKGEAPLKETLAAAMLAAAGWDGQGGLGLLDPCCGAGTIAIEAAQIACGIAPGLQRGFSFERLSPFAAHLGQWRAMQSQARAAVHAPTAPVWAGDVSFRMTDFALRNAERAGVAEAITFKTADVLQRPAPAAAGVIVMNPPYGERIEAKGQGQGAGRMLAGEAFEGARDDADFYARLAAHWKQGYAGWRAHILTPQMKLPSLMRLKESARTPLWNGPIECRLFRFDLVAGANRG